jgi:hypothetical protein
LSYPTSLQQILSSSILWSTTQPKGSMGSELIQILNTVQMPGAPPRTLTKSRKYDVQRDRLAGLQRKFLCVWSSMPARTRYLSLPMSADFPPFSFTRYHIGTPLPPLVQYCLSFPLTPQRSLSPCRNRTSALTVPFTPKEKTGFSDVKTKAYKSENTLTILHFRVTIL